MKGRDTEFTYAVAKVKALLAWAPDEMFFKRLSDAATKEDALSLMREQGYQGESAAEMTETEMEKTYAFLRCVSPSKEYIDIFSLRRDCHNLKVLLKAEFSERDGAALLLDGGCFTTEFLQKAISEKNFSALGALGNAAKDAWELLAAGMPREADCCLDAATFAEMLNLARLSQKPILTDLVVTVIDLGNLQAFLRILHRGESLELLQTSFLSGGTVSLSLLLSPKTPEEILQRTKYRELSAYVKDVDAFFREGQQYLDKILKRARWESFGVGPLVSYLFFKEQEATRCRQILARKG